MVNIGNEWDALLQDAFQSAEYLKLREFLKKEYSTRTIYPDMHDIFNALKYASYSDVKVVIVGQDPYHEPGQAYGLCFSVRDGVALPPSLRNIFKELQSDIGIPAPQTGELTCWARQGVLLLNNVLTVRRGCANSHRGMGWEHITDRVAMLLNQREKPVVFMLWGANARTKTAFITNRHHLVLECAHPSPLSAFNGFFGCRHFSQANAFLVKNGMEPVDWRVVKVE